MDLVIILRICISVVLLMILYSLSAIYLLKLIVIFILSTFSKENFVLIDSSCGEKTYLSHKST